MDQATKDFFVSIGIFEIINWEIFRTWIYMHKKDIDRKYKDFIKEKAKKDKEIRLAKKENKKNFLKKNFSWNNSNMPF